MLNIILNTKFSIRSYREIPTQDFPAFNAKLLFNGVLACEVMDDGYGGPTNFYWKNSVAKMVWEDWIKTLPPITYQDSSIDVDDDIVFNEYVAIWQERKSLARMCKKKTLFRIHGNKYSEGEYTVLAVPFSPNVEQHIKNKYGNVEIVNKQFV